jgi:RNA polymerase sigma-70 factor (ECF subfamily)
MFILDSWDGLLRWVFWMASAKPPKGGKPPSGGAGSGSGGGGSSDPEKFEAIFKQHFEEVLHHLLRKRIPREIAMELTQDTFFRVYQSIGEFRNESSLRTWIFSIAENVWRNTVRHDNADKRKRIEISLPTAEDVTEILEAERFEDRKNEPSALETLLEDERRKKLYEALKNLPARMRQCVYYRVHHGLMYREIAELMGIDIGTVKAQLSQAKARLEKELGPYFDSFDL